MPSTEALILRHYFELQGFLVRQCLPTSTSGIESMQIVNPQARRQEEIPAILFSSDLPRIKNAVVWLPNWNALKITPAFLKNAAELEKFINKRLAERKTPKEIEDGDYLKIIVVPAVPTVEPYRGETMDVLRAHRIDSMLSFRSVLQDLIARLDVRQVREGLQLLQILSNFDLLKTTQMELFNDERKK